MACGGSAMTTGEGEASGGDGGAAAALPRKKKRRAKGCKTGSQKEITRRTSGGASGDPV